MADTYTALSRIYRAAGLSRESEQLRARVFDRIQSVGWLGRRILELGCGVGESACWFSANGFRITAVDRSAAMLAEAQQLAQEMGTSVEWQQQDMLSLDPGTDYDLVISMNTLNELRSIRDLESVFQMANRALGVDKMLLFDLATISGLANQWGNGDQVLFDDPDALTLVVCSRFSYETLASTRAYIMYRHDGECWLREDETHVFRGYALQAVGTLLQRTGFAVQSVLNPDLTPFDPYEDRSGRAIVIAAKERDLA